MANPTLSTARSWLGAARSVCALTGAGISAESGIPTFRGDAGLWRNYRAEDLATPEAFQRNPERVWEWYNWRRSLIAAAQPNAGHRALAAFPATVITQNVDGFHQQAGSAEVIEIHGSIWKLRCTRCSHEEENRQVPLEPLPPRCACGGLLRPGVVWFGEGLDPKTWEAAESAARQADVLLVVGTSAVVYPAASLAPHAKSGGARIIEVNLEETPLSRWVDAALRGPSAEILAQLLAWG